MKKIVGIDPGKNGGITVIHEDGSIEQFGIPKIKSSKKDVDYRELFSIIERNKDGVFYIEKVHAIFGIGAGSQFEFGHIAGVLLGMVTGVKAPLHYVQPKAWQKVMFEGVDKIYKPKKKDAKTDRRSLDTKAMALSASKMMFPNVSCLATARSSVPSDGLVDSLLIAEHGRRIQS